MMNKCPVSAPLEDRLFGATVGALELFGVYLGDRLGLYTALSGSQPLTVAELAAACGIHSRYAREWLEQQAVAGILVVDDPSAPGENRRYELPPAHAAVVAEVCQPTHLAPLARMVVGIAGVLDRVVEAYRTGSGVPYARYGPDFRHGQGGINRPAFEASLVKEWMPAMSTGTAKLAAGGRVADLGCGQGWSAISVARAFPAAEVWGVDGDPSSIEEARRYAVEAGVDVRFECADAAVLAEHGPFDVVLLLEVLHDLARPTDVLKAVRRALAESGAVLVADEKVAPDFAAPGDELERMMYGWSITHCLPTQMAEQPSAAIGTVIRESTVRELASAAGFSRVDILDADGGFFRLYELRA
jgi:2-polyprenyl-3-methyl-5-hydroxy-6-metoxy-1,4-benzoquinol methylase